MRRHRDDWRIRATVGGYWEKYNILDQTQWAYVTLPTCAAGGPTYNCFLPLQPWPGSPQFTPNPATGFFDDVERGYRQLAEFASLDFDLIPKVLTITAGIRHFKYDSNETGGDVGSFYCKETSPTNTYTGIFSVDAGTVISIPPFSDSPVQKSCQSPSGSTTFRDGSPANSGATIIRSPIIY